MKPTESSFNGARDGQGAFSSFRHLNSYPGSFEMNQPFLPLGMGPTPYRPNFPGWNSAFQSPSGYLDHSWPQPMMHSAQLSRMAQQMEQMERYWTMQAQASAFNARPQVEEREKKLNEVKEEKPKERMTAIRSLSQKAEEKEKQSEESEDDDDESWIMTRDSKQEKKAKKSKTHRNSRGHQTSDASLEHSQDILESVLTKRTSLDSLSATDQTSGLPPEVIQASQPRTRVSLTSLVPVTDQQERPNQINLVSRLEKGFQLIKETITATDMVFIRNYSKMIGYPLRTTQRNTKLGYFTSVCTHEGCPAHLIIRKFRLLTPAKIEHNH